MDNRNFDQVVKGVENAERDVDKMLGAARLQRHEGPSTRMSAEQKYNLLMTLMGCVTLLVVIWILFGRTH